MQFHLQEISSDFDDLSSFKHSSIYHTSHFIRTFSTIECIGSIFSGILPIYVIVFKCTDFGQSIFSLLDKDFQLLREMLQEIENNEFIKTNYELELETGTIISIETSITLFERSVFIRLSDKSNDTEAVLLSYTRHLPVFNRILRRVHKNTKRRLKQNSLVVCPHTSL